MENFLEDDDLILINKIAIDSHNLLEKKKNLGVSIEEDLNFPYVAQFLPKCNKVIFNSKNIKTCMDNFIDNGFDDSTYEEFTKLIIMHEWGHVLDTDLKNILNLEDEISKTKDIKKFFRAQFLMEINAWKKGRRFCDALNISSGLFDRHNAFNLEQKYNNDIKKRWGKQEELSNFLRQSNIELDFSDYSYKKLEKLRSKLKRETFK